MITYFLPILLVVASNVIYQVSAKSVPDKLNPLASLTVTYFVGTIVSLALYFVLNRDANLIREYQKLNWSSFVLGFAVVGLEVGYIYAFKVGWPVSSAQIVQSAMLAVILIFVGYFGFAEALTWNRIVGILICLVGLVFINLK